LLCNDEKHPSSAIKQLTAHWKNEKQRCGAYFRAGRWQTLLCNDEKHPSSAIKQLTAHGRMKNILPA
jgi:hypothetical protein